MKIFCALCDRYMGEIRDATLDKNRVMVHRTCLYPKPDKDGPVGDVPDFLKDLFRGRL